MQLAFGGQPIVHIVPVLATSIAVQLECAPGDIALGHI
jgi:hypothetical protein